MKILTGTLIIGLNENIIIFFFFRRSSFHRLFLSNTCNLSVMVLCCNRKKHLWMVFAQHVCVILTILTLNIKARWRGCWEAGGSGHLQIESWLKLTVMKCCSELPSLSLSHSCPGLLRQAYLLNRPEAQPRLAHLLMTVLGNQIHTRYMFYQRLLAGEGAGVCVFPFVSLHVFLHFSLKISALLSPQASF